MSNTNRRDFLGMSFAAVAAVGGAASLVGMKQAWDPLPSVLAAGFTTVDLAKINLVPGQPQTFKWRGKPIFILEKTADMEAYDGDLVVGDKRYTVAIGLCTHLGCIPAWKTDVWKCACHGGEFDATGKHTFGPPPKPLVTPPFSINGTVLTLGEEGSESKAMMAARA
ncbi:MAG: Rieske 2Fe-2S domain-containing protein [Campylobacteraceae bacterium]|nr:Rieske 2Fe-2S domain-containing protein [Campylobacteraceae bacterium]MBT3882494.1 Rieske 2Fe-2S domain-containing protein [Campylobacteraceae bacterium]MBT4030487.1 Rieske 2Fe-2S domain-containing protein [Campylobacteraceae bacterium]MBT4179528.1 Rieske 2Fe-2S domain-containing protein [Campylobacteraceae bacterium]MBT4572194.1 Rieske 2Fe-2S domain-containing protein [Campylobacteraceae bacterium]